MPCSSADARLHDPAAKEAEEEKHLDHDEGARQQQQFEPELPAACADGSAKNGTELNSRIEPN